MYAISRPGMGNLALDMSYISLGAVPMLEKDFRTRELDKLTPPPLLEKGIHELLPRF